MAIKIHHLRDFLAVADRGSISAAAKQLRIAQPALSRSIRELERMLGAPLVGRSTKGTLLTPVGELFLRRARASMSELQRAQEEIAQSLGADEGNVTACLSSMSHVALLPGALTNFRKRYAAVRLRIIEGNYPVHEQGLLAGTIDFYIGPAPERGPAPGLRQEVLFDNTRCVLARKNHPLSKAKSLRDLMAADWVSTSITDTPEAEFNEMFAKKGLPAPRLILQAESALTWITAVATTDLLALTARQFADSELIRPFIERIAVREVLEGISIVHIARAAIPLTPAAQHFSDVLRREALHHAGAK
jgi:LysR family transcriptional regulator, regulator of abg operon